MDLVLTGHGSKKAQEFFDKDSTYSQAEKERCVGCGWGEVGVHCDRTKSVNKNLRVNTVKRCLPEALLGMWETWRFLNNG